MVKHIVSIATSDLYGMLCKRKERPLTTRLLTDFEIAALCNAEPDKAMIYPFVEQQTERGVISYGLSSFGYDMRVSNEFKVFTNVYNTVIDPKAFDERSFVDMRCDEYCIIPPNSFALARSKEFFRIPNDVLAICLGKSSMARCGLIVNLTPFEPGWSGFVTIEISNTTPLPAKVYANEGIAQVLFFQGATRPNVTYADKGGKYQNQQTIILPTIKR